MAFDKKRLHREIKADQRQAHRDKVRELRARIQLARLERKAKISAIRSQCAVSREKLRALCLSRRERAALESARLIEARKAELGQEQHLERLGRAADRRHVKGSVRSTSAERSQESDDEVRANLPRELVAFFDKHKRQIKGTARKTRTEAALQYAEENPDEVWILQNEQAEKEIRAMIREHNEHAKAVGASRLDEVPF